jgi:hypothetical protein
MKEKAIEKGITMMMRKVLVKPEKEAREPSHRIFFV